VYLFAASTPTEIEDFIKALFRFYPHLGVVKVRRIVITFIIIFMKKTNLHLISDSTGETLGAISRAVISQFENLEVEEFIWPLTRSSNQIEKIKESISQNPGIILYTILKDDLILDLKNHCNKLDLPCISALSRIIGQFSRYLKMDVTGSIGRQHILDEEYFSKVEAINYTIEHDDGQKARDLDSADIIIIGVSRTSKSPTSVFLSCRGYKTANIPFVTLDSFPKEIYDVKKPLIVGLTINPEKLLQVRQVRVNSMGDTNLETDYIKIDKIKNEIAESRILFSRLKCPIIDVTRRSVEETSAKIIQLYVSRGEN
jgi:regulator of PEP synthase PpsR (kinase-PPPase family)